MDDPAVAAAIAELRADAAMQRYRVSADVGGCLRTARRFAVALERHRVPHEIRRYQALPGWRTRQQHVTLVAGEIVDWIAPQFRAGCEWPDIRPVDVFEHEFGPPQPCCPRCGATLAGHRCLGPDEQTINHAIAHELAALPRHERRALERRLQADATRARRAGLNT